MMLVVKNSPANAGDVSDMGLIPGLGRSPGIGHDNPLWHNRKMTGVKEACILVLTLSETI